MINKIKKRLLKKILVVLIVSGFSPLTFGTSVIEAVNSNQSENDEPPAIGNFALPSSQQIGPLIGIGQNIIGKDQIQLFLSYADILGHDFQMETIVPSFLYGISDASSIFLNIPIALKLQENTNHSSGFEDVFVQYEYVFYQKSTKVYASLMDFRRDAKRGRRQACTEKYMTAATEFCNKAENSLAKSIYTDTATILANISFPTGNPHKDPHTGNGSTSFLLGATLNRTSINWYLYTSYAATLNTELNSTKFGNVILYQYGVGRNIFYADSKWIFDWLVEVTGQYTQKDKIDGMVDPNSGGNVIYVTPSLWFSSKKLILQLGTGWPVVQNLNGTQPRSHYLITLDLGWTLH